MLLKMQVLNVGKDSIEFFKPRRHRDTGQHRAKQFAILCPPGSVVQMGDSNSLYFSFSNFSKNFCLISSNDIQSLRYMESIKAAKSRSMLQKRSNHLHQLFRCSRRYGMTALYIR
jgi:hypothetical protein